MDNTGKSQESKPQERPSDTGKPQESKPQESKPQERPSNNGNRNNNEFWSPKYHNRWVLSTGAVAFTLSSLKSYLVFLFLFFFNLFSRLCI